LSSFIWGILILFVFEHLSVQSDGEETAFVTPRTQFQNSLDLVSVQ
jgi:hypothetical protein